LKQISHYVLRLSPPPRLLCADFDERQNIKGIFPSRNQRRNLSLVFLSSFPHPLLDLAELFFPPFFSARVADGRKNVEVCRAGEKGREKY
jgi:hypothetical protein